MTRISTLNQSQALLTELMRAQSEQARTQEQIASGKRVNDFRDLPGDVGVLLGAQKIEANVIQYQKTGQELLSKLSLQDVQLNDVAAAADDLRQLVTQAISVDSGLNMMAQIEDIFDRMVGLMNSQIDGKYTYGGTRTDVPPITVSTLDELTDLASVADAFRNSDVKRSMMIDDNQSVEFSFLATDIVSEVFEQLRLLKAYDRVTPFDATPSDSGGNLSNAANTFLAQQLSDQGGVPGIISSADNLNKIVAANGRVHNQVTQTMLRHENSEVFVQRLISDIEDVDMAEAVARFNQDQLQTEATARVLASLTRMSLLDFM